MDTVICLVGASGCGKTTVAKELEKRGYNIIQSYTTRKPRCSEEWGHTFIKNVFLKHRSSNGDVKEVYWRDVDGGMETSKKIIAYFRAYEGDEYFATEDQYRGKGVSVYIVDPRGACQVKRNAKDATVVTIYLNASEKSRHCRIFNRACKCGTEDEDRIVYADFQARMRIREDREIFKVCTCDYVIDADNDIKEVLNEVINILSNITQQAEGGNNYES